MAPPSSFTGSQSPALVARARVPPAAPPAPDDHRHVDQVLVVLVAEEALAQLGQPVLSALQGAHELLLPVAQQDVVVGPLADEGLVVVEVLAGRPQAQVGVVVLPRAGQLPVRAREQRVGPRSAPLSLEGGFQMAYILPERLLALVRPAFDLVLRRIRSLKRCVQAVVRKGCL